MKALEVPQQKITQQREANQKEQKGDNNSNSLSQQIVLEFPRGLDTLDSNGIKSTNRVMKLVEKKKTDSFHRKIDLKNKMSRQPELDAQGQIEIVTYFLPVYCRLKLKNVLDMNFDTLTGIVNVDLLISVFYGNLQQEYDSDGQDYANFIRENILVQLPKGDPILLKNDEFQISLKNKKKIKNSKQSEDQNMYHFTVRKIISTEIRNFIGWSPFQYMQHIITLGFPKVKYVGTGRQQKNQIKNRQIYFSFNLMDLQIDSCTPIKLSLGQQVQFGVYTFAEKKFDAVFTNIFSLPSYFSLTRKDNRVILSQNQKSGPQQHKKQKFKTHTWNDSIEQEIEQMHLLRLSLDWNKAMQNKPQIINSQALRTKDKGQLSAIKPGMLQRIKSKLKLGGSDRNKQDLVKSKYADPQEQNDPNRKHVGTKLNTTHHAHFVLPMYKSSLNSALKILLPVILLGIINIGISFHDNQSTGKSVINVAAIMISYIALVPSIRQKMGLGSGITFIQTCVFVQACTTLLILIRIVWYSQETESLRLQNDGLALSCIVITAAVLAVILVLTTVHYLYWQRHLYHYSQKQLNRMRKGTNLKRKQWNNSQCDEQFNFKVRCVYKMDQFDDKGIIVQIQTR